MREFLIPLFGLLFGLLFGIYGANVAPSNFNENELLKEINCPARDDINNPLQLPHPGDCSKFVKCSQGIAISMDCPSGLHWGEGMNRCEWPHIANCKTAQEHKHHNGIKKGTKSTKKSILLHDENQLRSMPADPQLRYKDCPLIDEDPQNPIQLPFPGDCEKFYKCSRGIAYVINCPSGLHWSVDMNRCEWPNIANCMEQERKSNNDMVPINTEMGNELKMKDSLKLPPDSPIPHKDCPGKDEDPQNPVQLPFPGDCKKFYKCSRGIAYPFHCSLGLHWSTERDRCEWPIIAKCETTPPINDPTESPSDPSSEPKHCYKCIREILKAMLEMNSPPYQKQIPKN